MKKIVILALAFAASATASFAQSDSTKSVSQKVEPIKNVKQVAPAAKDTVFTFTFQKQGVQLLVESLQAASAVVRRSPDLSALQADEAAKAITALTVEVYRQFKAQLPPPPAAPADKPKTEVKK